MKFLILRFSSIGDIVLTTPVLRCLRKKFPGAEIHYAVKKNFSSILEHNPYVDKIHQLGDSLSGLVNVLKKENFDYIIDLHHNQRTSILKFLLGVKSYSFNKINLEKWLMVNFKINRLPQKHIVDRYLETVQPLGVENDGEGLDYFLPEKDEIDLKGLPEAFQKGYIGWVIGAKQNTKKFPVQKIIKAIKQINFPIILLGGAEDKIAAESIITGATNSVYPVIINGCGQYSLHQSASLVKQAILIVANDTGLMHIAAAFRKPVISIWGNTIPEFGMFPYYGNREMQNTKFQIPKLDCRPCSKLGYAACPRGHFNCMNLIDETQIAAAIKKGMEMS